MSKSVFGPAIAKPFAQTLLASAVWLMAGSVLAQDENPTNDVMFVIDASNSMWGRIDGETKFDIARRLLTETAADLSENVRIGLVAYGHQHNRQLGRCDDIGLLQALGDSDTNDLRGALSDLVPKGQTPITEALRQSANWLDPKDGSPSTLVLLTDGQETCGGDPCELAGLLAKDNTALTIHTIGYDLDAEDRKSLQCIAENGRGEFFDATDAASLSAALTRISVSFQSEPPSAPTETVLFVDDFEARDLSDDWVVLNPQKSNYLLDQSALTFAGNGLQGLHLDESTNIFTTDQPLPDGDWDLHLNVMATMEAGRTMIEFGLLSDRDTHVVVQLWGSMGEWCRQFGFGLLLRSGGKATTAYQDLAANSNVCGQTKNPELVEPILAALKKEGARLTLSRRGRTFLARLELPGVNDEPGVDDEDAPPLVFVSDSLAALRAEGSIAISGGVYDASVPGSLLASVDKVELVSFE